MYMDFQYYTPTKVAFGRNAEAQVGELVKAQGCKKVLIHYGGKSAVQSGLIGRIEAALTGAGIAYVSLGGVQPNPRLSLARKGIELCKAEDVDFILAVGGGSTIDSAKCIAYGVANKGDVWDFYEHTRLATACLPVGVVLTIAAAGSEMSCGSVVTKDEGGVKRAYDDDLCRPKFAVMNPELTMTLPAYQTFSGIADILMHTMERWFNQADNMDMTDAISAALMKNVMKHARILVNDPNNYASRAEIMWAGSLSHNGLTGCATGGGDWASHNMEHELGGLYDVAHGAGLAAVWPAWARYVNKHAPHRFYKFAVEVMGVEAGEEQATIDAGIAAMEQFYRDTGMPTNLTELGVAPTADEIAHMAKSCYAACGGPAGCVKPLEAEDMIRIYENAK